MPIGNQLKSQLCRYLWQYSMKNGATAPEAEFIFGPYTMNPAPTLPPVTAEDQPVALAKAAQACGLLAQPGRSLRKVLHQMSRILPGREFSWMKVRAGMEMAVVDPVACLSGRSLEGIATTDTTILICPAEEAEKLVVEYAARGFATVKTVLSGRAPSL